MKQTPLHTDQPLIPWHPAFVEALSLELEHYRDDLEILPKYQLTSEPLRIDCVVIKKAKGVTINKNIAAIFRDDNLLEYKSPGDYIAVADFYKVYGYACLYAFLEKKPIGGLTISLVESRRPRKLLEHLEKERGYSVEKREPGIYTIQGDIVPIQIIDTRELREAENLWLRNLDNRLDVRALMRISGEAYRQGKAARIGAYLHAIAEANAEIVREALQMSDTALTLEKVFQEVGWIAKWEAKGRAEGRAEEKLEIARKMKAHGRLLEEIAEYTGLSQECIETL